MDLIFDREYLKSLFSGDQEKRIARIEQSLERANDYYNNGPTSTENIKSILQFEKDETIITLLTMAAIHRGKNKAWEEFISTCFPQANIKVSNHEVVLERAISASSQIQNNLRALAEAHLVKYIRKQAFKKRNVEGSTNFDAVLTLNNYVNVFIECKFTSDIDYKTTYVPARNQLARCIEVGLQTVNYNIDNFYFVLITPSQYKRPPGSRLYYYKMKEYQTDPKALGLDIPSLASWYTCEEKYPDLVRLTNHISWVTWEDCFGCISSNNGLTNEEFASFKVFLRQRCLLP